MLLVSGSDRNRRVRAFEIKFSLRLALPSTCLLCAGESTKRTPSERIRTPAAIRYVHGQAITFTVTCTLNSDNATCQ